MEQKPKIDPQSANFLHRKNPHLRGSMGFVAVIYYLRQNGTRIPNDPTAEVSAYLEFLADPEYVNDGILTGDPENVHRQVEAHVIKAEEVPEAYFELQEKIARERGNAGNLARMNDEEHAEIHRQTVEALQSDQRKGLETWVEYLGGSDGGYPDWFKYYVWESVTKLGLYRKATDPNDPDKPIVGKFAKRSRGTTAAYPELDREALAYIYDNLNKKIHGETIDGYDELHGLLERANFGEMYAYAIFRASSHSPESLLSTEGSWTKFDQTNDPRTARRLSQSLQGYSTGWCTAGESTAASQLGGGDFYVYYTRDQDGKDTVPRVAVRMENGRVAEVRGIKPKQEMEPVMGDIVAEKLTELPGGAEYVVKAEDMKKLTVLDEKISADPNVELTDDEIILLYEMDHPIKGFGYAYGGHDSRLPEIKTKRGQIDMSHIKVLLSEIIERQAKNSFDSYKQVMEVLDRTAPLRETFDDNLSRKMAEWCETGAIDWCAEQIMERGGTFTLNAAPNLVLTCDEIITLTKKFSDDQPHLFRPYRGGGYRQYNGKQLSGAIDKGMDIKFSLIPSTYNIDSAPVEDEKDKQGQVICEGQLTKLERMRARCRNVRIPSVLESVSYWFNPRNRRGGQLADCGAAYCRHIDLPIMADDGFGRVLDSCVYNVGNPDLRWSYVDARHNNARAVVG